MTTSGLDERIDALYALPLREFTAARNALARTLKGDASAVAQVSRLPKPAQVPAAVNLLYWKRHQTWAHLRQAGEALRRAQVSAIEGRAGNLAGATAAHRASLSDAVRTSLALAADAGSRPSPDLLAHMLEALSVASALPAAPGRFVDVLGPTGFEALAGIDVTAAAASTVQTPAPAPTPASPAGRKPDSAADRDARRRETESLRRRAEHAAAVARERLERAVAATALARAQVDSLLRQVQRAETAAAEASAAEAALRAAVAATEATLASLPGSARND